MNCEAGLPNQSVEQAGRTIAVIIKTRLTSTVMCFSEEHATY